MHNNVLVVKRRVDSENGIVQREDKEEGLNGRKTRNVHGNQCDQIWGFFGLWATF